MWKRDLALQSQFADSCFLLFYYILLFMLLTVVPNVSPLPSSSQSTSPSGNTHTIVHVHGSSFENFLLRPFPISQSHLLVEKVCSTYQNSDIQGVLYLTFSCVLVGFNMAVVCKHSPREVAVFPLRSLANGTHHGQVSLMLLLQPSEPHYRHSNCLEARVNILSQYSLRQ